MIFLIDHENVQNEGFNGLETLSKNDKVIIFYSENDARISMKTHKMLLETKARVVYIPVKVGGKNALDFQLSSYLGFLVSKHGFEEFCIVSKDKSFSHLTAFWAKVNVKVTCARDILQTSLDTTIAKVENKAAPTDAADNSETMNIINEILSTYHTKSEVHNALERAFKQPQAGVIYKQVKSAIK